MMKPTITYKEVKRPVDNMCANGHLCSEYYRRNGPHSPQEAMRFFSITGEGLPKGIYCEPCLVIANHLARVKEKK
ncbi:MAG: hypothetical protein HC877_24080 [Thioploca sp.]|nr:hypothetical protein [Thioploca sp.]